MTLWACLGCSAAYAVGLPGCPQCGSSDAVEEGTMPKISKAHGPTYGEQDPARAVVEPAEQVADETLAAEASPAGETETGPAPDSPGAPATGEGAAEGDAGPVSGEGPEQGQDGATDGASEPDGKGTDDEPVTSSKASTRRRTARG